MNHFVEIFSIKVQNNEWIIHTKRLRHINKIGDLIEMDNDNRPYIKEIDGDEIVDTVNTSKPHSSLQAFTNIETKTGYVKCSVEYELGDDTHKLIYNDEVKIISTLRSNDATSGYVHIVIVIKNNHIIDICTSLIDLVD